MDSTIVIKVKHGNTLRRFNVRVLNNGLEFNLDGLRNKIRGLFNFSLDADFILTYDDEDNDKITLGDDEDLRDVVSQRLNPLRISVILKSENVGRTPNESESVTTPLGASPVQNPFESLNSAVIEFISSLPEPMCKRIVESLPEPISSGARKMLSEFKTEKGHSSSKPSESGASTDSSVQPSSITLENFLKFAGVIETGSSNVQKSVPELLSNEKYEKLPSKTGVTIGVSNPEAITNNQSAPKNQISETNEVAKSRDSKESTVRHPILMAEKISEKEMAISKENVSDGMAKKSSPVVDALKLSYPIPSSTRDALEPVKIPEIFRTAKKSWLGSSSSMPGFEKWNKGQPNAFNYAASQCPFSGTFIGQTSPYNRKNYGYTVGGSDTIFHHGVQCDGCGVHPISGTRFKSAVMADYDLCSICFAQMGKESDYIRIDHPGTYHNRSLNGLNNFSPRVYSAPRVNPSRPRLDSSFIQDVNFLDGTLMTPSTPFTKIWRMKNSGSVVWPKGTRLIWIGGDKMGKSYTVDLEISGIGIPVGHEIDIAVDLIAPDRPGRYISYWMMISPTGRKFGQRVWVLIQVDAGLMKLEKVLRDFNLNNMPPSNIPVGSAPRVSNDVADTLVFNGPSMSNTVSDLSSDKKKVDLNFPINDNLLVGGGGNGVLTGSQPPSSSSFPLPPVADPMNDLFDNFPNFLPRPSDLTFDPPPHISDDSTELVNTEVVPPPPPPMADSEEENDIEISLLMELDRMGFKEIDLNKEVLRSNQYDLEKSLNDLCGVSEWDPILEELHEMGFNDDVMNKKLLEKNKGSVTQVVLDLLVDEDEY